MHEDAERTRPEDSVDFDERGGNKGGVDAIIKDAREESEAANTKDWQLDNESGTTKHDAEAEAGADGNKVDKSEPEVVVTSETTEFEHDESKENEHSGDEIEIKEDGEEADTANTDDVTSENERGAEKHEDDAGAE